MAFDAGVIVGKFKLDNKEFVASIKEVNDEQKKTITQTEKTGKSFSGLGKRVAGMVVAFTGVVMALRGARGLISSFMDAATESEGFRIRLRGLLGSVEEGNRLFDAMREYASKVPFEYREIMEVATQLSGVMQGGVDEVKRWMPLIGDLAAATGLSLQETTGQVIRMYSAGAASADMFRERGILSMLGFQAGVSYSAEQTRKKLIEAWEDPASKFKDMTKELATSWDGLVSMLKDAWFNFRVDVMEAGVFDILKQGLKGVLDWINKLKKEGKLDEWARNMAKGVISAFKGIAQGLEGLIAGFYYFKGVVYKILTGLTDAMALFQLSLLEIHAKLWFVPGMRDTIKGMAKNLQNLAKQAEEYSRRADEQFDKAANVVEVFDSLIGELEKAKNATYGMKIAQEGLNQSFDYGAEKVKGYVAKVKDSTIWAYEVMKEAVDKFQERTLAATYQWGNTTLTVTRNIYQVLANAQAEYKDRTFQTVKETKSFWDQMADGLQTKWASTIGEMLRNIKSWKDGLKKIWDAVVVQFTDMVGQLIAKWVTDFIGKMIKSTASGIAEVGKEITGGIKNVVSSATSFLSGGIATGIGAFAGTFLGSLAGGMGPATKNHIKDIVDNTKRIWDVLFIDFKEEYHVMQNIMREIRDGAKGLSPKMDVINRWLSKIYDSLSNMVTAQHGLDMIVDQPTLFMAGDAPVPERVNVQRIGEATQGIGGTQKLIVQVPIYLEKMQIGMAVGEVSGELSKRGHFPIYSGAIVES